MPDATLLSSPDSQAMKADSSIVLSFAGKYTAATLGVSVFTLFNQIYCIVEYHSF